MSALPFLSASQFYPGTGAGQYLRQQILHAFGWDWEVAKVKGEELTLSGRRLRHDMVLAVSHADALKVSHRRQPGQHRLPWGSSAPPPALGECGASCGRSVII